MANLDGYFTGVTDAIAAERKAMAQAQRDAEKRLFAVAARAGGNSGARGPGGRWVGLDLAKLSGVNCADLIL